MLTLALVSAATNEVTGLTNTYNQVSPWLVYLACTILISTMVASLALWSGKARSATVARSSAPPSSHDAAGRASLVRALVERRSVFPRDYARGHGREVPREVVDSMLEAACWAPFHGSKPPWRFVVLGKQSMRSMQELTLRYYDEKENWRAAGRWADEEAYARWREMTEGEITGRWGPVSYMIAIVMRRQAGSKRVPEWEEMCATAAAVQNMHVQLSSFPDVGGYWSSWHSSARDSEKMRKFLNMEDPEDKCLGFFIVAPCETTELPRDRRSREAFVPLTTEWRD